MLITENNLNDLYKLKTKELYTFVCKKCGKKIVRQYRPDRVKNYKKMLCKSCDTSSRLSKNQKVYFIKNEKDLVTNLNNFNKKTILKFKCIDCEKMYSINQFHKSRISRYKDLRCSECHNKYYWTHVPKEIEQKRLAEIANTKSNWSKEEKEKNIQKLKDIWHNKSQEEIDNRTKKCFETKIRNHGDKNYNNIKKAVTTRINWTEERKRKYKEKISNTCKNRTEEEKNLISEHIKESWKNKSPEEKEKIKQSIKRSFTNHYGVDNPMKLKSIREKVHQTMVSKSPEELRSIYDKIINTRIDKYGTISISIFYNYYGICFDSKPELAVWIYCIDHNIPIIRSPCRLVYYYDNKNHYYEPDFMINVELVEIKGDQYLDKETGKWTFPYSKSHRNSDKLSIEEKEYYDDLYEAKHQCAINNNVKILYKKDYQQYIDYCNTIYPNWDIIYRKDNIYNPSYWCYYIPYTDNTYIHNYYNNSNYIKGYGISPFDIDKDNEYTAIGKGVSPFDINLV